MVVVTLNASAAYRGREGSKDQIEEDAARGVLQRMSPLVARSGHANDAEQCLLSGGDLNRSTQHLLILLDKEVADGDVTDIVHGEAKG